MSIPDDSTQQEIRTLLNRADDLWNTRRLFDLPLTSVLDGERIDLGLGIGTLRHAAENHPGLYNPDKPSEPAVDVTDAAEFAKAVIEEINREDEEGNTLLTRMIDKAIFQAVENGCEGVNHDA